LTLLLLKLLEESELFLHAARTVQVSTDAACRASPDRARAHGGHERVCTVACSPRRLRAQQWRCPRPFSAHAATDNHPCVRVADAPTRSTAQRSTGTEQAQGQGTGTRHASAKARQRARTHTHETVTHPPPW